MKPEKVVSPKSRISEVEVIMREKDFSIASFLWNGQKRIGIRWDGEGESIGYPHSRGYANWFVLPKEVALSYAMATKNAHAMHVIEASSDEKFC